MTSAFDELNRVTGSENTASFVTSALWAGQPLAAIAREWEVKTTLIRKCRDELFAPFADPKAVKAAANGPLISAHALNRPRASRSGRKASRAVQAEMFPA